MKSILPSAPAHHLYDDLTRLCRLVCFLVCFFVSSLIASIVYAPLSLASDFNLPELGSSSGSIVSEQQENALGQQWLRAFRRQAPIEEDALVFDYTEALIAKLAYFSDLRNKNLNLLMVDNSSFNAFAVPGNVIGINTGLFAYAESEDQLASVIAHELAHLSQRHFARTLERQKEDQWKNIAAMLAGILVLATVGGEEGAAAITAAQASTFGGRLKYSRLHEQEADRVGIATLSRAGMNPSAAAFMFQKLLVNTRYRQDIKEFSFMLTHPLTDSRVTDAFNQSRQYPQQQDRDSFHFHLIKNRLYALKQKPRQAIDYFSQQLEQQTFQNAAKYGLALSYLADQQLTKARPIIAELYRDSPHEVAYAQLFIELLSAEKKVEQAFSMAEQHLALHPGNYPLAKTLAELSISFRRPSMGREALYQIAASRGDSTTPDVWYLLAEMEGLAGNISQVHLNRAEYFASIGAYIQAIKHIKLAIPLLQADEDYQALAKAELRQDIFQKLDQQEIF